MKNTIKKFIVRNWKVAVAYIASLYGTTFTTLLGIGILMDDVWASDRLECTVLMTCLPAMIWGVSWVRKYWIAKALSGTRDLMVVEPADKAA